MLVRLKESGSIDPKESHEGDSETSIERRAMLVYAGTFDSMDGEVIVKPEHIRSLVKNHNSVLSKVKRLASGTVHLKHYPPIQLDHSTSARDTIGRLVGDLSVDDHETPEGKKVPAVFGMVRFLGKENVERVNDGRWTHLSIGADFDKGTVSELSVTPFPAAKQASLLKEGNTRLGRDSNAKLDFEYKGKKWRIWSHTDYFDLEVAPASGGAGKGIDIRESDADDKGKIHAAAKKAIDKHGLSTEPNTTRLERLERVKSLREGLRSIGDEEKTKRLADLKKEVRLSNLKESVRLIDKK